MANMPSLHKDGALTATLTVTASSTTYQSAGFDLKDTHSALHPLQVVLTLSSVTGGDGLAFQLLGDVNATIDGSSVLYYTTKEITADGKVYLAIPEDFAHEFVGVACVAEAGESATVDELFLDVQSV